MLQTPRRQQPGDAPGTSRRRLSYAEVTRKEPKIPKKALEEQRKQSLKQRAPSKTNKTNTASQGASRFTSLRASQAKLPPKTRRKALFVTRLERETTTDEVLNHLREVLPRDVPIKVTELRSEYQDFYASFHVAVPPEAFREINDSNIWSVKARFRPFRGQLHGYRKLVPNNEDMELTESPRRKAARRNQEMIP